MEKIDNKSVSQRLDKNEGATAVTSILYLTVVATKVLKRFAWNAYVIVPSAKACPRLYLVKTCLQVVEIGQFEIVDDGQRTYFYPVSSPGAFGSDYLKCKIMVKWHVHLKWICIVNNKISHTLNRFVTI